MSTGAGLAITVGLLVLNGFFVAAEFAIVAARRSALEPLAEAGSRRAAGTIRSMEQASLMMAGAQLGITVCSLALGAVSEPALAHLFEPLFHGLGLPESARHPVAFVVALLIVTVLHVVLGEMVPKNVTLAGPERAALWLSAPLSAIVTVLRPLIWLLNEAASGIIRLVRVEPRDEVSSTVTRAELTDLVDQSRREGMLDADDHDLLTSAIDFESATARNLLTPMERVRTIAPGACAVDVEAAGAATGFTRFPVRDGDRLTGYVHLKDTLALRGDQRTRPLPGRMLRALPTVDAGLPVADAIEAMRSARAHLARVTADGRTLGVVTLDDILGRLVQPRN